MLFLEKWGTVFNTTFCLFFLPSTSTPSKGGKNVLLLLFFTGFIQKCANPRSLKGVLKFKKSKYFLWKIKGCREACVGTHNSYNGSKQSGGQKFKYLQGVGKSHKLEKRTGYAKNDIQLGDTIRSSANYGKMENRPPMKEGSCYSALAVCCLWEETQT